MKPELVIVHCRDCGRSIQITKARQQDMKPNSLQCASCYDKEWNRTHGKKT